jgi:hypothetical protein
MNLTTQRMIGECVEKRSKFNFIMGQLPSELQLEILDYIPRKVIFEPEELSFLQLIYTYTFYNHLEDYSSWFTEDINYSDFIECFGNAYEYKCELDYELLDYEFFRGDDSDEFDENDNYYDKTAIDIFLKMIPNDLRKNRTFMNALIKKDSKARDYVIEPMTDQNCLTISFTEEQFSYYRKFALHSVESYGVYSVLCRELKNNREIVMGLMEHDWYPIRYGEAEELRNDREIIFKTVRNFGWALEYASENLKNDKEIVFSGVQNYGLALEFASENLKNDKEIVFSAVQNMGLAYTWASDRLKNDKEISLKAVQLNWKVYEKLSDKLKNNKEIALKAVQMNWKFYEKFSDKLKNNKEIFFEAGEKSNWYSLIWVPDKYKNSVRSVLNNQPDNDIFRLIAHRMGINN